MRKKSLKSCQMSIKLAQTKLTSNPTRVPKDLASNPLKVCHITLIELNLSAYILHLFNKGQIKLELRNFYTSLNKCIDRFKIFHIVQVRVLHLVTFKAYNECSFFVFLKRNTLAYLYSIHLQSYFLQYASWLIRYFWRWIITI
jgi:hypothetical protein